MRFRLWAGVAFAAMATLACAHVVGAQESAEEQGIQDERPTRFPETGMAILDCAPPEPAPELSCLVRVPTTNRRGDLERILEPDGPDAKFDFVRPQDSRFPDDVTLSATLILIDTTPGVRNAGGRNRTNSWSYEKEKIKEIAEALPSGELVAVYGFGGSLERLQGFTSVRSRVLDAIDAIQLDDLNTRIAAHTESAIGVLAEQDNVLLRNLIVVTDGDEEGIVSAEAVSAAAEEASVAVSTVGMFWLPIGNTKNARAMDFLDAMASPEHGTFASVELSNQDAADEAIQKFTQEFNGSINASGLVLPEGEPGTAEIVVNLEEPIPGLDDQFRDVEARAYFVVATEPVVEPAPPEDPPWWQSLVRGEETFGLRAGYVWAIFGGLLLLLGLLLYLALRSSRRLEDKVAEIPQGPGDDEAHEPLAAASIGENTPTVIAGAPANATKPTVNGAVVAYLVRADTGDRFPVVGARASIGRSRNNAVVLEGESVSRVHAELHRNRTGGFSITDMDSLNGTFINEERIKGTVPVRIGDSLSFGKIQMKIVLA